MHPPKLYAPHGLSPVPVQGPPGRLILWHFSGCDWVGRRSRWAARISGGSDLQIVADSRSMPYCAPLYLVCHFCGESFHVSRLRSHVGLSIRRKGRRRGRASLAYCAPSACVAGNICRTVKSDSCGSWRLYEPTCDCASAVLAEPYAFRFRAVSEAGSDEMATGAPGARWLEAASGSQYRPSAPCPTEVEPSRQGDEVRLGEGISHFISEST